VCAPKIKLPGIVKNKERRNKNAEQNKTRETKRVVICATDICMAGPIRRNF